MVEDGRLTEIVERRNVTRRSKVTTPTTASSRCRSLRSHRLDEPLGFQLRSSRSCTVNLPAQLRNRLRAAVVDLRWAGPREHVTRFRSPADAFALHRDHHAKDCRSRSFSYAEIESGHRPNTPSFEPTTASGLNAGVDDRFRRSILQQRFEQRCQSARCELLVARFSDLTHRPPPRARQTLRQEFLLRERRCNDIRRSVHEEELLVLTEYSRTRIRESAPDDGPSSTSTRPTSSLTHA